MNQEMVAEVGQVVGFTANVNDVDGIVKCDVVRVGLFNAVCDGKYEYSATKGEYSFLRNNLLDIQKQLKVLLKQTLESKLDLISIQPVLLAGS